MPIAAIPIMSRKIITKSVSKSFVGAAEKLVELVSFKVENKSKQMRVDDSELLGEFLSEKVEYSSDLKAMILLMVAKQSGNIVAVNERTGIASWTIYSWLLDWNKKEANDKKKSDQQPGAERGCY